MGREELDVSVSDRFFMDYCPLTRYKSGERAFFALTHPRTDPLMAPGLSVLPIRSTSKSVPTRRKIDLRA